MRQVALALLADTSLNVARGGEWFVLSGALLTAFGAVAGLLQFRPTLKGTRLERVLDAASTAALGIGGTAGLYGVYYSTAYVNNKAFGTAAVVLLLVLAGLTRFVFTRKRPAAPVLAPGLDDEENEEKEEAGEQDDGDDGDENVDEGGEDHAPDDAPATPTGARISQPLDVPVPDDAALTPEHRSAAYGALGGAVAALVVAALLRRPK